MNSKIRSVVSKDDQERVKEIFEKSDFLLDILAKVCYNIIRESQNVTKKDYDSAGWAYEQAHRNGQIDALQQIIKIIGRDITDVDTV
jgi:hypothetical protein